MASTSDCVGDTPLHDAVDNSNPQQHGIRCLQLLLAAGANINAQNAVGNTALHNAYKRRGEKSQLIDRMMQNGADHKIENNVGLTAPEWEREISLSSIAAIESDRTYKQLYNEKSGWQIVQRNIQERVNANRRRFADQRANYLSSLATKK